MGLIDKAREWFIGRAVRKALLQAAGAAASYGAAHSGLLESWGVTVAIDPDALAAALFTGLNVARNWLKVKAPKLSSWL